MKNESRISSRREEIGNTIVHGIGIALSIAGLVFLVVKASFSHNTIKMLSFIIFGITLLLLYSASTLKHFYNINGKSDKVKHVLMLLDKSAIYLLIAGTYTPLALGPLRGITGWTFFGTVWGIALIGIILNIFFLGRYPILFTSVYLAMGWICVVAWKQLLLNTPHGTLVLLLAGGIVYSLGVIFHALQRMRYNHLIWHFFVLGGSIIHYFAILLFL
jgi:hemolysin III